jgi:hypothetical protein
MRGRSKTPHLFKQLTMAALAAASLQLTACESSSESLYEQARAAAEQGQFNESLKLFEQLGAREGATIEQRYQATFGRSEVELARGDLKAQAGHLEALYQDSSMSAYRDVVAIKLEESYLKRAEKLGLGDAQLVVLLTKAIKLNPKSPARRLLTEHYMAQGIEALKAKRFDDAEDKLKSAQELKSADEPLNKKIAELLKETRLTRYMSVARRLIEAKQDELSKAGRYDLVTQRFPLTVEVEVEGKVSAKNREELSEVALPIAEQAMSAKIASLIKELLAAPSEGELSPDKVASTSWDAGERALAKRSKRVKRDKKRVYMTSFSYQASVSLEALLRLAFTARELEQASAATTTTEAPAQIEPAE